MHFISHCFVVAAAAIIVFVSVFVVVMIIVIAIIVVLPVPTATTANANAAANTGKASEMPNLTCRRRGGTTPMVGMVGKVVKKRLVEGRCLPGPWRW